MLPFPGLPHYVSEALYPLLCSASCRLYKERLSWTQTQNALVSLSLFRLPPDGRQDVQRTGLVFISDFNKNVPVLPSLLLLYFIN